MGHIVGIDLGTTNSCVATMELGQGRVLENAEGGRTTPSVVAFLDDGERLVGASARRQAVTNPQRTIFSIKRFMGRKLSEVDDESKSVPYQLVAGPNDGARVLVDGHEHSPEEISAAILVKLKSDTEAYLGEEVTDAVITVPAYFNDAQRQATKNAAAIAGLNVLRIINEPTAAALAYGFQTLSQTDEEKTVLVFDLGGGTFDVSVLEIGDGVYDVKATKGDNHLGGNDFDRAVVDWMVGEFKAENGIDLTEDPGALQRLYEAAEKAKMELSSALRTHISLPFITTQSSGPLHLDMEFSRAQLNELCEPLLERLVGPLESAVADAELDMTDLDSVLLVGGMTRMPAIAERVQQMTGLTPLRGVNPDEAVALGAAIQAGVLSGEVEDVLLLDVTPLSLGIETKGGLMTRLIDANTTVPVRVTESFTTADDNQPSVEVHILQGERDMAVDNRSLGRVVLFGIPPALAGTPQIEVTFDLDADGILNVTASDLGTGDEQRVRIEASTGLSGEEVERLKREAELNAERDRAQRDLAEARNRAQALRDQARRVLRTHAEQMDESDRAAVMAALDEIDGIIANTDATAEALNDSQQDLAYAVQTFSEKLYANAAERAEPTKPEVDEDHDVLEFSDEPDADDDFDEADAEDFDEVEDADALPS